MLVQLPLNQLQVHFQQTLVTVTRANASNVASLGTGRATALREEEALHLSQSMVVSPAHASNAVSPVIGLRRALITRAEHLLEMPEGLRAPQRLMFASSVVDQAIGPMRALACDVTQASSIGRGEMQRGFGSCLPADQWPSVLLRHPLAHSDHSAHNRFLAAVTRLRSFFVALCIASTPLLLVSKFEP